MRDEPAMLRSTTGETMALEGVDARGHVRGLLFELDVEQRYRNPHATNIEAIYTFPLPMDAVLLDLEITLGGRVVPRLVAAYADVPAGEACALVGSTDRLEIAVHGGRADTHFAAGAGTPVAVRRVP